MSVKVFHIQKKVIRLMAGVSGFKSCRQIFLDHKILTVASPYILEILFYKQV
jgi:hypothetical protein